MDDNLRLVLIAALSGLFGLLTGVGVAALGFRFTERLEASKAAREDRHRDHETRRLAYERFLGVITGIEELSTYLWFPHPSKSVPQVTASLEAAEHELALASHSVELLGDDGVVKAAWRLREDVLNIEALAIRMRNQPGESDASPRWDAAGRTLVEHRVALTNEMRRHQGEKALE